MDSFDMQNGLDFNMSRKPSFVGQTPHHKTTQNLF
jgi:hypothetical protein